MTNNVRVNVDSRMLMYSENNSKGGDPSTLFDILEGAIEREDWNRLTDDDGEPLGSFLKYIEAPYPVGCGMSKAKLLALLNIEHRYESKQRDKATRMEALREAVTALLGEEVNALHVNGANQHTGGRYGVTPSSGSRGNDPEYILARLKRDRPDLADQVMHHGMSHYKAAKLAGIHRPETRVYLDDVCAIAAKLASKLDTDQINELISELRKQQR